MQLHRLYKNDNSSITGCPAVYADDAADGQDLVVVGSEVDAAPARQISDLLPGERAVVIRRDTLTTALHRLEQPKASRNVEPFSPDWYGLFEGRRSIFRLELLQSYNDPGEAEALRRFQVGELPDPADADWWTRLVNDVRVWGGTVQRVHVVAEPLSDYLKFELAVYAAINAPAGEDVRILPAEMAAGLDLPGHDYWLFDSRALLVLRYDSDHRLATAELVSDPAAVVRHCYWRDVALADAIPHGAWMAGRGKEELATHYVSP